MRLATTNVQEMECVIVKKAITERALMQRINRKLRAHDEVLRKARGMQLLADVGEFYRVNVRGNWVAQKFVDPQDFARRLGVLQEDEQLASTD